MAQRKQIRLGIMRLRIRSLASLSGLRIRHCGELWCRLQMQLRSGVAVVATALTRPLAWNSIWGPKKTKNKKTTTKKPKTTLRRKHRGRSS